MDKKDETHQAGFDALFDAAKAAAPAPSADLMARILADAQAVQAAHAVSTTVPSRRAFTQVLSEAFGGWAGVSALAACVCLGIFVGFTSPDAVLSYVPGIEVASLDDGLGLYFDSEL